MDVLAVVDALSGERRDERDESKDRREEHCDCEEQAANKCEKDIRVQKTDKSLMKSTSCVERTI